MTEYQPNYTLSISIYNPYRLVKFLIKIPPQAIQNKMNNAFNKSDLRKKNIFIESIYLSEN